MALFGNLFKKKECAICGGEIGLLGNRKLEDGNMCKKCASKLSPWFEDRRHATVADVEKQLEYRAQNEQELKSFNPTRSFGNYYKMHVEERNGVPYRFVVSNDSNWRSENPDIILFKDVTDCTLDVDKYERELKYKDESGEEKSYFPQRFEYNYNFFVEMKIANNPYFDDIRFKLNNSAVIIESERIGGGMGILSARKQDHTYHPQYRVYQQMFEDLQNTVQNGKSGVSTMGQAAGADPIMVLIEQIRNAPDFETIVETNKTVTALVANLPNRDAYYVLQTQAMKEANERVTAQMTAAAAAQPVPQAAPAAGPKFCTGCGAPASGKFCENCGTKLF